MQPREIADESANPGIVPSLERLVHALHYPLRRAGVDAGAEACLRASNALARFGSRGRSIASHVAEIARLFAEARDGAS